MDEIDRKKEAIDNALLFLSSAVPFGFSILALASGLPFYGLFALGPLLMLAVVLPLYVGYLRGAIELDSIGERARGWVYLIYGSGTYTLLIITDQLLRIDQSAGTPFFIVVSLVGLISLPWLTRQFVLWTYRVLGQEQVPIREAVGIASTAIMLGLSSLSFYVIGIGGGLLGYTVVPTTLTDAEGAVMAGSVFILPLLLVESNCHRYLDEAVGKIPPSNLVVYGKTSLDNMAKSFDRYERYTWAVLFAGSRHKRQYTLMAIGFALNLTAAAVLYYLSSAALSLPIAVAGGLVFLLGLSWHIKTDIRTN